MFSLCQAKLGEETLDYKDLAALPKTKAIYNIDRPDMLSYSPYVSYPSEERHYGEVGPSHWPIHSLYFYTTVLLSEDFQGP